MTAIPGKSHLKRDSFLSWILIRMQNIKMIEPLIQQILLIKESYNLMTRSAEKLDNTNFIRRGICRKNHSKHEK